MPALVIALPAFVLQVIQMAASLCGSLSPSSLVSVACVGSVDSTLSEISPHPSIRIAEYVRRGTRVLRALLRRRRRRRRLFLGVDAELDHLRFDDVFVALRADRMAELGF